MRTVILMTRGKRAVFKGQLREVIATPPASTIKQRFNIWAPLKRVRFNFRLLAKEFLLEIGKKSEGNDYDHKDDHLRPV